MRNIMIKKSFLFLFPAKYPEGTAYSNRIIAMLIYSDQYLLFLVDIFTNSVSRTKTIKLYITHNTYFRSINPCHTICGIFKIY